tara:strand:- start:6373 stop:6876 length:504 start_codon:yes stop_codon:yes gene_type:complete
MLYNLFRGKPLPMARISSNRAANKVVLLVASFFIYGLIYFFFCYDTEFKGINIVKDKLRDDIVQKYVEKVKKHELSEKSEKELAKKIQGGHVNPEYDENMSNEVDPEMKEISESVTKKDSLQSFFDRFYFAVVTGTTLGYGDIQPASNKVKIITLLQLMTTIYILIA